VKNDAEAGSRPELFFRPAEIGEDLIETGEGQTYDVEVAAFDAGNEAARVALNGVGAGLVMRLAGGEIAKDLIAPECGKMDERGFHKGAALGVGEPDEGDAGDDRVGAAGKFFEHAASVIGGAGLAEDVAVERNNCICANDDRGADGAGGHELGFSEGEALDQVIWRFVGVRSFVNSGREHNKRKPRVPKDFSAAR